MRRMRERGNFPLDIGSIPRLHGAMQENRIKRTIIVTIDLATVTACNQDVKKFLDLQNYLAKVQMTPLHKVGVREDGLYFKREIIA